MQKCGWHPKRGLGKAGGGSKIPIGTKLIVNTNGLIANAMLILDNKPSELGLCLGIRKSCLTCNRTPSKIFTIFSELDECESEYDTYSLSKLPEIEVLINGHKTAGLIDSGSQITAISISLYETITKSGEILPEIPTPAFFIQGAFGSRSERVNKLRLITIKLNSLEIDVPVMILRRLPYNLILGHDFLQRVKAVYDCGPDNTLTIEHLGCKTQIRVGGDVTCQDVQTTLNCLEAKLNKIPSNESNKLNINDYVGGLEIGGGLKILLKRVLERNKSVFSSKPGRTDKYVHKIIMSDETPFVKRSYPIPFAYREQVKEKIDELEKAGIIERQSTPYCSPMTFVRKRDGNIRLLLDARELNSRMVGDVEAPPLTSEIIQSFYGVRYISVLDCSDAYYHVKLEENSKKYTGFTFMGKGYVYNVLPQGLKTSVASFSRAMDIILGPDVRDFCTNYLDDLIIHTSGSMEQHLEHLDIILIRLKEANMNCNLAKCSFLRTEVKLLGHIVSTSGIKIDPEKIKAIKEYPPPKNIRQLRAFMGFINYFRRFVYKYGELTKPLNNLLCKGVKWGWSTEIHGVFERIKELFLETVMLVHPDTRKPYILQTDSSGIGVAGCVYQLSDTGDPLVVGFCSKAFKEAETKYTVSEQELYAIIYSLTRFETYLRGAKLVIKTDHKSLTFIQSWKLLGARLIRWVHYLERFDYQIEYIKGKDNVLADTLSRYIPGVDLGRGQRNSGPFLCMFKASGLKSIENKLKSIGELQKADAELGEIIANLLEGKFNNNRYCLVDGVLHYNSINNRKVVVIPKSIVDELIRCIHEEIGHFGRYKVYSLVKQRYFFNKMKKTISRVLRECEICQKTKCDTETLVGPCKPVITERIGECVFADLYGPLPTSRFGYKYLFVMQDSFSKYLKLYTLRKATSKGVLCHVKKYHSIIKIERVVTDNGTQFTSEVWTRGLSELEIEISHTTIRNPRPNCTERVNRELGRLFRCYSHNRHNSWADFVGRIEDTYNNLTHSATGFTPVQIVFGESPKLTIDRIMCNSGSSHSLDEMRNLARENIINAAKLRKQSYDKRHRVIQYNIGDIVKLKILSKSDKEKKITKKFNLLYKGPYRVAAIVCDNVYTLLDEESNKLIGNYNAIHLSRFYKSTIEVDTVVE